MNTILTELSRSIHSLRGPELEYAFLRVLDVEVVGPPTGPFAIFDKELNSIVIIGESVERQAPRASFLDEWAHEVVHEGLSMGATLSVKANVAHCTINGIHASGVTYIEAMLRTLLLYFLSQEASVTTSPI